jgi:transposase-like protein
MEKKLFRPHYNREFKTTVVEEYLATGCTKMSLLRKYNIQFKSAIQTWMRVLGYNDPNVGSQRFKFGKIIFTPLSKQKKIAAADSTDLQKKFMNWNDSSKMKNFAQKLMQG